MPIYENETDLNTMIHFGHGDLVVSTSDDKTEVIITPVIGTAGVLGERAKQYDGKPTSEIPQGVRLVFDNPASAMVVIDALSSVVQDMLGKVSARLTDYPILLHENMHLQKMVEVSKAVQADREARNEGAKEQSE